MDINLKSLWLLAQLKPNCGDVARRNLTRQGFSCFRPMERKTRRHRGRLISVKAPFFPGYIFVGIDAASSRWSAIRSTYGVSRLIGFGVHPATVPAHIIEELMRCCESDGCVQNYNQVSEGDTVKITHGPFTDFVGRVDKLAPKERAWVLIDIMGKATRSSLQLADLEPA